MPKRGRLSTGDDYNMGIEDGKQDTRVFMAAENEGTVVGACAMILVDGGGTSQIVK